MNNNNAVILTAPVTMKIGPVPENVQQEGSAAIFSFGIQNFSRLLSERGVPATVDGKRALATFAVSDETAKTQNAVGVTLDGRDYRVQPAGDQHELQVSIDTGGSFKAVGTFYDFAFADAVGAAWVDGRVEKIA